MVKLLARLKCWWGGHEFYIENLRRVSPEEVVCPCNHCARKFSAPYGLVMPGKLTRAPKPAQ
jgi:hypothetical protein